MTLRETFDALMYQLNRPNVTTMGPCERECGSYARGSAACRSCLAEDIDKVLGGAKARQFVFEYVLLRVKQHDLEDAIEAHK
jgi:hypothetical protein